MECREALDLLHGYLDGELELAGNYEIERHFAECARCAARLAEEQQLHARLGGSAGSFRAPPHLRNKISAALDDVAPRQTRQLVRESGGRIVRSRRLAGAVAAAGIVGVVFLLSLRSATDEVLIGQVRDSHVRSLMAAHLADVESSDQHTVKPWFAGRIDFAPWVADLSDEGFRLVGGRLDYFSGRPVAALVFKRREHVINLLTWPDAGKAARNPRLIRREGFQIVHWSVAGIAYWAISDLNAGELEEFAALVRTRAALLEVPSTPAEREPATRTGGTRGDR
jgi:anti-sigma factor RsiW